MNHVLVAPGFQLQTRLWLGSANGEQPLTPHHPITCTGRLRLEQDGRLCCDHSVADPDDERTQACIDHSISWLLMELAAEL
ncbi:MAG: hypothetical protein AB1679_36045 [Actinomycetota bacterium]|jgi:hypothetical protein